LTPKSTKEALVFSLRFAVACACLVLLAAAGCQRNSKKVSLQFKYEPGLTLDYRLTQKVTSELSQGDSVLERESREMISRISSTVRSVADDSTAELLETSNWQYGTIRRNGQAIRDTTVYTREVVLHVRPNGEVTDVEFPADSLSADLTYLKHVYELNTPTFPDMEVSPGYTWSQTAKVLLDDQPVSATRRYRVQSFAREQGYECAVISYEGELTIPVQPAADDSTARRGVNHITSTGILYFAFIEGTVVSSRDRWLIDGVRTSEVNGTTEDYQLVYEADSQLQLVGRTTGAKPALP
jgi:hypothetical protein